MVDEDRAMDRQPIIFERRVQEVGKRAGKGACGWVISYYHGPAGHVGDPNEAAEEREVGDGI